MPPLLYLLDSTIATGFVDRKPAKRLAHLCRVASATNGLRCQPGHEAGQYLEHHQRLIYFGPRKYANVGAAMAREETMPSAARRFSASRTGPRLTPML